MADQPQNDTAGRFLIKGQYVKDLSFENPHSPHSLISMEEKPRIDFNVELQVQRFNEQHYELTLHMVARAMGTENTLFLVELDYAGIIQFINIPEDKAEPILYVDCAFILYPFARRVLADVTRDGGFPPLMLEPIDFHSLYAQNKQKLAKA
jgi:preprotein translocase subunit SecB